MRALIEPLSGAIIESADRIMEESNDPAIRREALIWKIEAVGMLREALFRSNPYLAIEDSWVLALQLQNYFETGVGRQKLGDAAPVAVATCQYIVSQIEEVAATFTYSGQVEELKTFFIEWAAAHPIQHSIASRESTMSRVTEMDILEKFSATEIAANLVLTADDLSRRIDVYSVQLLDEARWQAELFAMDQRKALELDRMMALAETAVTAATNALTVLNGLTPQVSDALYKAVTLEDIVARERELVLSEAEAEIDEIMAFASLERTEALAQITREREAAVSGVQAALAAERARLVTELERIADQATGRLALLSFVLLATAAVGVLLFLLLARRLFRNPSA